MEIWWTRQTWQLAGDGRLAGGTRGAPQDRTTSFRLPMTNLFSFFSPR